LNYITIQVKGKRQELKVTHNLTLCLGRSTLAGKMGKEIPDWLKKTRQLRCFDNVINGGVDHEQENNETDNKWGNLRDSVLFFIEKWNGLEIDRICNDLAQHVYHSPYHTCIYGPKIDNDSNNKTNSNQLLFSGNLFIEDKHDLTKNLGNGSRYGAKNLTELLEKYFKSLEEQGIKENDVSFGFLQASITHQWEEKVSGGTGYADDDYTIDRTTTDCEIVLTKDFLSINNLNIPLDELKTPNDLEEKLDTYFAKIEQEKIENSSSQNEINKAQHEIFENLNKNEKKLHLNDLLKSLKWHIISNTLNIGQQKDEPRIPSWVIEWIDGEPARVDCVITSKGKTNNKVHESYFIVVITANGRVGFSEKPNKIADHTVEEFPSGGRGFGIEYQTNEALENIIRDLFNNPPLVYEYNAPPPPAPSPDDGSRC